MTLRSAPATNPSHSHRPYCQPLRRSRFALAALVVAACVASFALAAKAQQAQPPSKPPQATSPATATAPPMAAGKLSSHVKLVTVFAIVRGKHGKIIPNLAKDDFSLDEDGRPQTISHFIVRSDVPLTLGLLVDTSPSQRAVIVPERKATYTFLDRMLTGKDRAFIIHFDREVELLQDLTSSRPKLQSALQLLDTPKLRRNGGNPGGNGGANRGGGRSHGANVGGDTHLYDAIWLAANDLMKKQQGRKALFVLSDGVDRGSKESLSDAVEAAQRADTAVYTIYFPGHEFEDRAYRRRGGWSGPGWPGRVGWPGGNNPTGGSPTGWPGGGGGGNPYPRRPRVDGKKILLQISRRTGGVMFEVSDHLSLDRIFSVAADGLRNQYELGYTPNPPDKGAGYHMIRVKVNKKHDTVQARRGYYSAP